MVQIRPTHLHVDLPQLQANYNAIQQFVAPVPVMPVLKANAYGLGLVAVAQSMIPYRPPYIAVAFPEEAIQLRQAGIETPILMLGPPLYQQADLCLDYDLTLTVPSLDSLRETNHAAKQRGKIAQIHLKIDTGMGRIGVQYDEAVQLLSAAEQAECCEVTGIYSHFANADMAPDGLQHAQTQLDRFLRVLDFYGEANRTPPRWRHMANSGGILQLPGAYFDMVRAGIILYGQYPSALASRPILVRPAATWRTQIAHLKRLPAGLPVGYGSTWISDQETTVATIPVGYGDGLFRLLSNRGHVLIRGRSYPIIGRVCMDQCMVSLGDDDAAVGDEVILLGRQAGMEITADQMATWAETISYEVLTHIGARVPRMY